MVTAARSEGGTAHHLLSYGFDDDASDLEYRSDVKERAGTRIREVALCPFCGPQPNAAPVAAQKAGAAIDLSSDSVGQRPLY